MKPRICYTVWFSQRNGSTLLCEGLTATGIAGKPAELLEFRQLPHYSTFIRLMIMQRYKLNFGGRE